MCTCHVHNIIKSVKSNGFIFFFSLQNADKGNVLKLSQKTTQYNIWGRPTLHILWETCENPSFIVSFNHISEQIRENLFNWIMLCKWFTILKHSKHHSLAAPAGVKTV